MYYNTAYIQTLEIRVPRGKNRSMPWPYLTRIHSSSHGSLFQTSIHMHYTLHSLWHKYALRNIHINIIKRIYIPKVIYILDVQKENVLKCFTHILFILLHQDLLLQCLSHIVFKGQWTHIKMSHFTIHFMALINLKISLESKYTVSVLCNTIFNSQSMLFAP